MVTIADSRVSLGITHAEVTFVDELCSHRRKMTISKLRTRLHYLERGGVPLPLPQSSFRHGGSQAGATSSSSSVGLSMTVMANPLENRGRPIIGADIKHFHDYRYRPFSKQICR